MTLLVFLNELSNRCGPVPPRAAKEVVNRLVGLLRVLKSCRRDLALHSAEPIRHMTIGDDYPVALWCNDGDCREEWRFLRSLANQAPFGEGLMELGEPALSIQYSFQGAEAKGLGWAHLAGGLAISLDHLDEWRIAFVPLTKEAMDESDDGVVRLLEQAVDVTHAASPEHVSIHRDWIVQACRPVARDPNDLWRRRAELFPNLSFLPRVEAQIRGLHPAHPWFGQIAARLEELDAAVAEWEPRTGIQPQWRTHVTPEHEGRRALCSFEDEGVIQCFDLHARFTPSAGRLHFRLDGERRRAVVAHAGMKLGT